MKQIIKEIKKIKEKTGGVAKTAALLAGLLCITVALSSCGLFQLINTQTSQIGQTGVQSEQIIINIENDDIPDYIKELIKLDTIFNLYSYDGINSEDMESKVLKAYVDATGDIYAEYLNSEEYEDYTNERNGDFVGVGVSIINSVVEINGYNYKAMQIISVFENSPAIENDVRVGDYIVYVGSGEERTLVDLLGYTKALDVMLGEEGTMAEFTVFRPDDSEAIGFKEISFSIERRKVVTESVKYNVSETDSKVGIINITNFDLTTPPQFRKAVDALKEKGCEYFVFDLRNNPGGSLDSIIAVLSLFLDKGDLILSTEYSDGEIEEIFVEPLNYGSYYKGYNVSLEQIGMYKDLKSIVLVNENSASAAELFTATFRDYGIAKIVGETTYGKGCMQTVLPLERYGLEGGLIVTTAMYFSKSHYVYHDIGIEPDFKVALSDEALGYNFFLLPEEIDNQLQKAIEELVK